MTGPYPRSFPEELGRLGLACLERYETEGDGAALAAGLARLEEAVAAAPEHPQRTRWWYGLGSAYECRAVERASVEDYDRAIGWYGRLYAELPAADPDRTFIALTVTGACWNRYWLARYGDTGQPVEPGALVDRLLDAVRSARVDENDPEAAGYLRMVLGLAHQERYGVRREPADLDRSILLLAGALPGLPADTPWIAVATLTLATAYRDRYVDTQDGDTLDLAVETAAQAVALSGEDAAFRLSAYEYQALCLTDRWNLAGDRGDLDGAIESLRVLLADGDDGCSAALCGELMRERAELTRDPVDAAEAVRLLDRAVHDCPDEVVASERWVELHRAHRILAELGGQAGRTRYPAARRDTGSAVLAVEAARDALLPGPPGAALTLTQLRAALARAGRQAMVYLVPAVDSAPAALVVPVAGEPRTVPLPGLATLRGAGGPPLGDQSVRALQCTAEWAWRTAMRPVLECLRDLGPGRPYRLVLVPVGELGLVPWHAARGGSGRYLVQDAVVSYAASGRLFRDAVDREPVPGEDAPSMVVADPAIHEVAYPAGRLLGAPGPELLDWLRGTRAEPAGMLHLAGPQRLSAKEIVEHAWRGGTGWRVDTVVLAAGGDALPPDGYDAARSSATAFLTAGAGTVVGSHWPLPARTTPVLTFMLHHYLTEDRVGVANALRLAQLWMLNPTRPVPRRMPLELRLRAGAVDPHDLAGWAGFSHAGR